MTSTEKCYRCKVNPPTAGDGRCWPCHTADAMTGEHRAQPVADMLGVMYCGRCGKPTRQWPDGRFPIHAST